MESNLLIGSTVYKFMFFKLVVLLLEVCVIITGVKMMCTRWLIAAFLQQQKILSRAHV